MPETKAADICMAVVPLYSKMSFPGGMRSNPETGLLLAETHVNVFGLRVPSPEHEQQTASFSGRRSTIGATIKSIVTGLRTPR